MPKFRWIMHFFKMPPSKKHLHGSLSMYKSILLWCTQLLEHKDNMKLASDKGAYFISYKPTGNCITYILHSSVSYYCIFKCDSAYATDQWIALVILLFYYSMIKKEGKGFNKRCR